MVAVFMIVEGVALTQVQKEERQNEAEVQGSADRDRGADGGRDSTDRGSFECYNTTNSISNTATAV